MINLRVPIDPLPIEAPIVVRLSSDRATCSTPYEAILIEKGDDWCEYDIDGFSLRIYAAPEDISGDVLLIAPRKTSAHRLIRASSNHNTFLVTEQCDQVCVMCSQPPKKHHVDQFDYFSIAATLAPEGTRITMSGGEPLLHKSQLFEFITTAVEARPDLRFHVLSNGQFFAPEDRPILDRIGLDKILWGIPLYSASSTEHDSIVGKPGAFKRFQENLAFLTNAGASVEIRTVVMKQNWSGLSKLAGYISTRLPSIDIWALMQLENIGFARMNWERTFKDTSVDFDELAAAINIALGRGIPTKLYNFPLCSLPTPYRPFAPQTISDWKNKFLDICSGCGIRESCGGFFEWYKQSNGFGGLAAQ